MTEADREMLRFLARHRYATVDQLGRRFGRSPVQIRRRRGHLARAGFVASLPVRPFEPWVCLPTGAGIRLSGLALPVPEYSQVTHDHTLGCVDLAIAYELGGATVISEREARSSALADRDWSLPGEQRRRSYPDLIVLAEGSRPEAIELELNAKTPRQWVTKLDGYRSSDYGQVTYWIPDRNLARRFAHVVEAEGLAHLVRIRRFVPGWSFNSQPLT